MKETTKNICLYSTKLKLIQAVCLTSCVTVSV